MWTVPFRAYLPIVGYDVMFVDGEDSIMNYPILHLSYVVKKCCHACYIKLAVTVVILLNFISSPNQGWISAVQLHCARSKWSTGVVRGSIHTSAG